MKVLLKVGSSTFLLASDAGLQTVVKALSQAVSCNDWSFDSRNPRIKAETSPLEVSVKYLTAKTKIEFKNDIYADDQRDFEQLRLVAPTAIIPPPAEKEAQ